VLGALVIEHAESAANRAVLPGRRAQLVFAYLAVEHRRAVSRDELANALWPDLLPDSWAAALRGVITDVRRFLDDSGLAGSELIVAAHGGYQLRLPPGVTVDVDEARAALADARAGVKRGDAAGVAAAASRAATIAGLPFLPRHDGEWVQAIRADLEAIQVAALELAARAHLRAGDVRAAIAAAEKLVRAEPYREAGYQLLIDVLGQARDRAGALRVYDQCRSVLHSELNLKPSRETEDVLSRALAAATDDERAAGRSLTSDVVPSKPPRGPPPAPVHDNLELAAYGVLVVEDHDFQRRTALMLLRRLGVGTLLEASDGAAALSLLEKVSPPDVIICDLDMPGMDGVEFIRHVARRGLASAVAIVSGLDRVLVETARAVAEGYGLQVLGAVEKPLTISMLTHLLAAYQRSTRVALAEGGLRLSAAQIAEGLADDRVVAYLEPIADLSSGRITAAEVIPRWRDHAGIVRAASFAAALEVSEITERLAACLVALTRTSALDLSEAGVPLALALKIPHTRLVDAELADRLADAATVTGAEAGPMTLAIGVSALPGDAAVTLDVLVRLRLKGFRLWLDEASIDTEFDGLPVTGVRFGGSLVASAITEPSAAFALRDAVERASANGLMAIGAGCAGPAEFALLLEIGASHAQGGFVAGAMTVSELAAWARDWTAPALISGDA
jgi:DNA-binding SARP family transcriptional activator/EAL domain-containing protein (putative c-di-GMP-specific phosphodiesterase class I)/FixJ family two-component response regulator